MEDEYSSNKDKEYENKNSWKLTTEFFEDISLEKKVNLQS